MSQTHSQPSIVLFPKKVRGQLSPRQILDYIVRDQELHMFTLNRYRFSEQRTCKELTEVIEQLKGYHPQLTRDLSKHIADEAHHALWLTDLLLELDAEIGDPVGVSYTDKLELLADGENFNSFKDFEDAVIAFLVITSIAEKRACQYFAAHITALKALSTAKDNIKIIQTLTRILPEEAEHVRWGTRWLTNIARKSPEHHQKVELAKLKYMAIEQAAFDAAMDIAPGAELRRLQDLFKVASLMPFSHRAQYILKRLSVMLFDPQLQKTRLMTAKKLWQQDPQKMIQQVMPALHGDLATLVQV